jgi:Zn-finger nucleic acid-binding protein
MSYSVCNTDLLMSERLNRTDRLQPEAPGIWLTHGKSDKLIEKPGPSPDSREKNKRLSDDDDEAGFRGYLSGIFD